MRRSRTIPRHSAMLERLEQLGYAGREYAGAQGHYYPARKLRLLAEEALRYAAAVRTLARSRA